MLARTTLLFSKAAEKEQIVIIQLLTRWCCLFSSFSLLVQKKPQYQSINYTDGVQLELSFPSQMTLIFLKWCD